MSGHLIVPDPLRAVWDAGEWRAYAQSVANKRALAIPHIRETLDAFLAGRLDLSGFVQASQKQVIDWQAWGFKGPGGQMTLNTIKKAALNVGWVDEASSALRAALRLPETEAEAAAAIRGLIAAFQELGELAVGVGVAKPSPGNVPFVVTYFWEIQAPERWPVWYPNSRNTLRDLGLFKESGDLAGDYLAYASVVRQLAAALGGSVWDVERALAHMRPVDPPPLPPPPPPPLKIEPAVDAYALYAERDLVFPDEVITSFLLSLWTKPFVLLTGISGTGKTQIAIRLAEALDVERQQVSPSRQVIPAGTLPEGDERTAYVRTTLPTYRQGSARPSVTQREAFPPPARGTRLKWPLLLPDGTHAEIGLRNVGLSDQTKEMVHFEFRGTAKAWLDRNTRVGDVLELTRTDGDEVRLRVVSHDDGAAASDGLPRYAVIPVRPDWTDSRGLLGYWNPLVGEYVSTPFLDLAMRAAADPGRPYFAILDEMNLARVEYYFADVLSAMESDEPIPLHAEDEVGDVPTSLAVPPNLFVIGTVNVDETTHAFSPKVLDRASVLEFHDVDVNRFLTGDSPVRGSGFRLRDPGLRPSTFRVVDAASPVEFAAGDPDFASRITDVHALLEKHRLHFGYRVLGEMTTFAALARDRVGDDEVLRATAFDLALAQKVLPKLNGGRELEEPLLRLLGFLVDPAQDALPADPRADYAARVQPGSSGVVVFPRSAAKVARMLDRLDATGFVSFLE